MPLKELPQHCTPLKPPATRLGALLILPIDILIKYMYIYMYIYGRLIMDTISYTKARENLASTMEKVCDDHNPLIITRKSNRSVVMLSLEDYQAMEETTYLLRSPKNAKRLLESIVELENGEGLTKELIE